MNPYGIKPISANEFGARVVKAITYLTQVIGQVIMPFAILGMMLSVGLYIIGSATHHREIKKLGLIGIGTVMFGVIFYYSSPLLIGIASEVGKILGK